MALDYSNLSDSLDDLSKASSAGTAKVKANRGRGRKAANKESAESLLDFILDDSGKAAEEEERQHEEARKRAEEEEALRKEREELQKRMDGEMALLKEQKSQAEMRKMQSQMLQAVEREKAIEAGLIDVAEEERLAREAEEKKRQEEEEKARKAREKKERKERILAQKAELEALQHEEAVEAAKPQPSKAPQILIAVVLFLAIAGGVAGYLLTREHIDIYALKEDPSSMTIGFLSEDRSMQIMAHNVVEQEKPKAPTKPSTNKPKPKNPGGGSTTPAGNKPGLNTGKGGGLSTGKGGGLGARKGGGLGSGKL